MFKKISLVLAIAYGSHALLQDAPVARLPKVTN